MAVPGAHGGAEVAWPSWIPSLPLCCEPLVSCLVKRPGRSKSISTTTSTAATLWPRARTSDDGLLMDQVEEKHSQPVFEQPPHHPHPVAFSDTFQSDDKNTMMLERPPTAAKRRRFWSLSTTTTSTTSWQRPQISAPTEFRHISTASPAFPDLEEKAASPSPTPSRASNLRPARQLPHRRSFRPLELSIYLPDNNVSPILPHFETENEPHKPDPAYVSNRVATPPPLFPRLEHQRSFLSPMNFHLPRPRADTSPSTTMDDDDDEIPPLIPPKSKSRARAYTAPEVDVLKERVATALIEVDKLQKQIDEVIERQSQYTVSRPSSLHSMACTSKPELEPMPSIPALPPAAPSFAERLNASIDRPHTAPIQLSRNKDVTAAFLAGESTHEVSSPPVTPPPRPRDESRPLAPPLPLVLRPPLRKKKSFSQVSSWLFPGSSEHVRNFSLDSVTNLPKPVKDSEGFYQCVSPGETQKRRRSSDSAGSVSTWESDDEDRTIPSTWSPGSTSAAKMQDDAFISRGGTFGKSGGRPGKASVGLAY